MPAPIGDILSVGAPIAGAALGIAQYFGANKDIREAREELNELDTPFYKIQDEYFQNKNMAGELAQGGLPAATKDYLASERDRAFGSSVSGISQTGGGPNDFAGLFDSYNRSLNQTAAQDAAAQVENIKYFAGANKDLAGQKTTQWALNEYQPYQNKLKELTQRIAAGKQNRMGGLQTAIGGVGAAGTALQNKGLFGDDDPVTAPSTFRQVQEKAVGKPLVLPTSSPNTGNLPTYQSAWSQQQEADTLASILGNVGVM